MKMIRFNIFLIKNNCFLESSLIEVNTGRSVSYVMSMNAKYYSG